MYFIFLKSIFTGRTDAEAEVPILWPPDAKSQLFGKDPDAGKDWRQEKGVTEDEMVGWRHQLNGHELEQPRGDHEGQGRPPCCSPLGHKMTDTTERLDNMIFSKRFLSSSLLYCKNTVLNTYKKYVNQLFTLLVSLPENSRLLVVNLWVGVSKVTQTFDCAGVQLP